MGGGAFLINDGDGYFELVDSIYFDCGFAPISGEYIDNNNYIDIYGRHQSSDPHKENIAIIYNYGLTKFDSIKIFFLYEDCFSIDKYTSGDVNGDGFADLLFAYNIGHQWGIIYNNGIGNFSAPVYFDLDYPPLDIACADLNDDGRSDVVITDYIIEVYFSTETGFEQQLLGYAIPWSSSYKIIPSDFDIDGDIDVIITAKSNSNHSNVYMFENLGHNEFYEHDYFEFTPFCSYAKIADFNNDSLPDIVFIADDNSGLFIYNNMGDFQLELNQFIPIENDALLQRLTCNDFDNNNYNDIAFVKGYWGATSSKLEILFNNGKGSFVDDPVSIIEKEEKQKNILSCYPNPFTDKTTISINLNKNEKIKLEIYDIQGKLIRTFIDDKPHAGVYKTIWTGKDLNGKEVKAGIYFVRLILGRNIYSQKLVFSK
ncbi:MAG: T9SS type A sorting domain-containing protein [Bacteroidales bacterium]|nr:T9SS type A sorting domain-containing protein [Bacteroidales bacterium]